MTDVPVLVPEGKHLTNLTMGELDTASRHLQCDVLEALESPLRYAAFIEFAVIWAKRSGDTTKGTALIERFRGYTTDELFHALRMDEKKPGAGDGPDPTQSTSSDGPSASS